MKILNRHSSFLALSLALSVATPALSAERPFDCGENIESAEVVESRESLIREMAALASEQEAVARAQSLVKLSLTEALQELTSESEIEKIDTNISTLVNNPVFKEAVARALFLSGVKKPGEVEAFKTKLASSSEEIQIQFARLVVRQYDRVIEKAFSFVDEERMVELEKRWGLKKESTLDILRAWNFLGESRKAEVMLGTLAWSKSVDAKMISTEIRKARKLSEPLPLNDAEKTLVVQITKPHSQLDLAMNRGPITEDEFERRMRVWSALGLSKVFANRILYSKASFAVLASFAPVGITHALFKDWNITNTLATVVGGVATCAPIVDSVTVKAIAQQHDAVWLDILTLRQLSEFRRWTDEHPKSAKELGFSGLEGSVDERIKALRLLAGY